jgi:hypothetical protein
MERLGIPKHIVGFVLPTGYSFNLDGSTLYLSLASVFIAQAAGVHMPLGTQITMMLTLMLTSKGVAAVRRNSRHIPSADRRHRAHPRRRRSHGYVPHFGKPSRQLRRHRGRRALGRRRHLAEYGKATRSGRLTFLPGRKAVRSPISVSLRARRFGIVDALAVRKLLPPGRDTDLSAKAGSSRERISYVIRLSFYTLLTIFALANFNCAVSIPSLL